MNNNLQTTNKAITIKPSARKSIHSDCETCLSKGIRGMGKYGLGNKCSNKISELSYRRNLPPEDGVDEVDNVKRDCANHSSPKAYIRKVRKNSVDSRNQIYSDESDDEDTSEEFNSLETVTTFTPEKARKNNSNVSNSVNLSPNNLQVNRHPSPTVSRKEYLAEKNGVNWKQYFIVPIIITIALSIHFYDDILNLFDQKNNTIMVYDKYKFHKDVTYLGEKYKVTDDSILKIKTGISTIFQKQDAGSFIFTYNSKNLNFNPTLFDNFMNDVATAAAKYLRNDSDIHNHVIVDSCKLDMNRHGELIERYREDVTKTGVMLVKDVDQVPASLAMAFHYYCDEYNPLIKKSAIFFTLNMARCSDQDTSHANVEKCLANKWTAVPKVNIIPLLARVVSILIDVTSVF